MPGYIKPHTGLKSVLKNDISVVKFLFINGQKDSSSRNYGPLIVQCRGDATRITCNVRYALSDDRPTCTVFFILLYVIPMRYFVI